MTVDPATKLPDCNEGSDAATKFDFTMGKLLSVSHDELLRREAEYRKRSLANPNRRGRNQRSSGVAELGQKGTKIFEELLSAQPQFPNDAFRPKDHTPCHRIILPRCDARS